MDFQAEWYKYLESEQGRAEVAAAAQQVQGTVSQ